MGNKKFIFFIATIIAFAAMVLYIVRNVEAFKRILHISPLNISIFFVMHLAMALINALVLWTYIKKLKRKIPFVDIFGITTLNTFFNNILIKGGPFIKAYFLKKVHKFPYTDLAFTLASFTLIQIAAAGILGICALLVIYIQKGYFYFRVFLLFVIISSAFFLITRLSFIKFVKNKESRLGSRLLRLSKLWQQVNRDKNIMYTLFILALLNYIIFASRLKYGFYIMFDNVTFVKCLVFSVIAGFSNLLAITPGALGIREFFIGGTCSLLDGNMLQAVVVTTLDRAVGVFSIFFLCIVFAAFFLLRGRLRKLKNLDIISSG